MKRFLILISVLICLIFCLPMAAKNEKPLESFSQETQEEYVNRMLDTIRYFLDNGYYTEVSYLLADLNGNNPGSTGKSAIEELQNTLTKLYAPDKENSVYNTDNLYMVKDYNGKYGYIDENGHFVIEAKFDKANQFSDGLAYVRIGEGQLFINRRGETVIELKPRDNETIEVKSGFGSGLALIYRYGGEPKNERGYYYIDKQGVQKIFLPCSGSGYDTSYEPEGFSEGFARVKSSDGLFGYIDTNGNWLVKPAFEDAYPFQNGMAIIRYPNTNKFGFIDTRGKVAFRPFIDDWARFYLGDVAWAKTKDGFMGQIDKTGATVLDTKGMSIEKDPGYVVDLSDRRDGLTLLLLQNSIGMTTIPGRDAIVFLDKNNKKVMYKAEKNDARKDDRSFDGNHSCVQCAYPFSNGRTFVKTRFEGWAMIDLRGNFIVKPQCDWIPDTPFFNGLARVYYRNFSKAYINRSGQIVYKE